MILTPQQSCRLHDLVCTMKNAFTTLGDRNLWFDGTYEVDSTDIVPLLLDGVPIDKIFVKACTPEVNQYNAVSDHKITLKDPESSVVDPKFLIPEEYKMMDLQCYFSDKLSSMKFSDEELEKRQLRVDNELAEFAARDYLDMLRTIIYLIDTFRKNGIVWGVGRGSSCASYLLYLIGVHCVDPVRWNIHFNEFLHD